VHLPEPLGDVTWSISPGWTPGAKMVVREWGRASACPRKVAVEGDIDPRDLHVYHAKPSFA
jgi:hypothetical protein